MVTVIAIATIRTVTMMGLTEQSPVSRPRRESATRPYFLGIRNEDDENDEDDDEDDGKERGKGNHHSAKESRRRRWRRSSRCCRRTEDDAPPLTPISPARNGNGGGGGGMGPRHIDLLDAQGEMRPCDFKSRLRASGTRDYGEDVAERNMAKTMTATTTMITTTMGAKTAAKSRSYDFTDGAVMAMTAFAEESRDPSPPIVPRYRPRGAERGPPLPRPHTSGYGGGGGVAPGSPLLDDRWNLRPVRSLEARALGRSDGPSRSRGQQVSTTTTTTTTYRRPASLAMTSRESLRSRSRRTSSVTAHSLALEFAGHVPERGSSLKQWSISSSVTPTTMTELSDHSSKTGDTSVDLPYGHHRRRSKKKLITFPLNDDDDDDESVSSSEDSFTQRRRRRRRRSEVDVKEKDEEENDEDGESLLFKQQGYGGVMGGNNLPGLGDTTIVSFSPPSFSSPPSSSLPRRAVTDTSTKTKAITSGGGSGDSSRVKSRNRTSAKYRLRALGYIYDTDDDDDDDDNYDDDDDDDDDEDQQDSSPPRFLPDRKKNRRIGSRRVMRIEPVLEDYYEEGHAADMEV
ncbi:hypothetical protein CP532_0054 [Ophiocordyceps camponoti-leonardi (nom. inval.)]|nr:hypothetical protein CP532_0054 [Ophiocordyceps camponoti-leonardi (nom. inval.)]